MKKKIVLILLSLSMIFTQASAVYGAEAGSGIVLEEVNEITLPKADVFDVDFSQEASDLSPLQNGTGKKVGNPQVIESSELHKKIARFDGSSAYTYEFTSEKYEKINKTVTMECMVKFNSISKWGEADIFSTQENSGIGIGLENGMLTFFAHTGGEFRKAQAAVRADQWYHIVGVVDGTEVKLYVNGTLMSVNNEALEEGILYPEDKGAQKIVLGGDCDSYYEAESMINADLSFGKIYSMAMSDEQVLQISKETFDGADIQNSDIVTLGLIGADTTAEGGEWDLNLHTNDMFMQNVNKIEYDIVFDEGLLEYKNLQHLKDWAQISKVDEGKLHVVIDGNNISKDEFRKYSTTRIGKLTFLSKDVDSTVQTNVKIENFKSYYKDTEVVDRSDTGVEKTLSIYDKNALDFNEDGVIGAGDVALAEPDMKKAVAEKAAIYPYKHVVILTLDGAGNIWNPDFIYYAPDQWTEPSQHTDAEIMAKRTNTYAMELLNQEFATSYSAQAVIPSISAQNYFSILHGIPWGDVPEEYQLDNTIAGEYYYPDFGIEEPKYPSVFQVVGQAFPERNNAAFAEWGAIVNGIIEPDVSVAGKVSEAKRSFWDVADYIGSSAYKNTAVVYMQNDEMDHIGHGQGYFTDVYWEGVAQYDEQYKAVMDALEESGEADETLIITNSDHGGSWRDHGSERPSDMDIFIGVWGQTVDSGKRLKGGTNADISPIALSALRIDKPDSMTGGVFDETMFLTQEQMQKKERNIDQISFRRNGESATLNLEKAMAETRVIDAVIDLKGAEVYDVVTENGTVLRQDITNGKLKLTISYEAQPEKMAEIRYTTSGDKQPELEEIMLGTESGEEVYPDIQNVSGEQNPEDAADKTALNLAVTMAEKLEAEQTESGSYTEETWEAVQTALDEARILLENPETTQAEADSAFLKLMTAINLLESDVQKAGLGAAIEGAKAILADASALADYTPESVEAVRSALAEAEAVYADTEATQTAINQAAANLMTAVNNLLVTETDNRLDILIQKAEELLQKEDQYTSDSVQALKDALEAARDVAGNKNATEQEINDAYNALAEAMASLVRVANKAELENALNKANEILTNAGKYTDSSLECLQEAKDAAQGVYDNDNATQEEIEEALKDLINEILEVRLLGDVKLDEAVDSADAQALLRYNAELEELSEEQLDAADVNRDEAADSSDAGRILQYAAEMIEEF